MHKKEKNAEHTRMYTIFRAFSTQYSRRLLSILAQTKPKQTKTKQCVVSDALFVFVLEDRYYIVQNQFAQLCIKIKKMRSTHACTPSFAHLFLNIHVGCCLFSHKQNKKNKIIFSLIVRAEIIILFC